MYIQIVVPALTSLHLHILWSLQGLDETKPDRSIMRNIRTLTETLVKNCHNLLKLGSQAAQQEAFVILCDLLMVFAKQLKNRGLSHVHDYMYMYIVSIHPSI